MLITRVQKLVLTFMLGICDSLRFQKVTNYIKLNQKIKEAFIQACLLNLVIFTSLTLLYYGFLKLVLQKWYLVLIYNIVLCAVYLVVMLVTGFLFNDIAKYAIKIEKKIYNNQAVYQRSYTEIDQILANHIYHFVFFIFFFIQILAFSNIRIQFITPIIRTIHLSFFYSICCFEYKWGIDSNLAKNLQFYEQNVVYFIGFGFIFSITCDLLPFWLSISIYSTLLPLFLMTAIPVSPPDIHFILDYSIHQIVTNQNIVRLNIIDCKLNQQSIGIFFITKYLSNKFQQYLRSKIQSNFDQNQTSSPQNTTSNHNLAINK